MDPLIESMRKHGIPVTRKGWLELNYPEGVPKVLTAEQELEIPESTGVLLVAVVRQGRVITNPPSDFEIQREDSLIVHGDKDQIHRAEELLREGKTATEG